ncbi:hypothetical protein [Paenibacillus sp. D51F]
MRIDCGIGRIAVWEGRKIKVRHLGYFIIILLLMAAFTVPSDDDYHRYLSQEHGVKCLVYDPACLPGSKKSSSEQIGNYIAYMQARTKLEDGGEISILGMFGHFFVLENNLN